MYGRSPGKGPSSKRELGLSLLARGQGLLDGGVEIECSTQLTAYSLGGQPFVKPSLSREGQRAKVVKPHVLNLPKTYVTRRGPLVLFTSPEDMIIGKTCQMHEQEQVRHVKSLSRTAVSDLKTTNNLTASALTYDTEKDSGISEGEGDGYSGSPHQPGNFTSVYLENLTRLSAHPKVSTTDDSLSAGKSEAERVVSEFQPDDSDSGFDSCSHPTTSGRLSAFSNHSDAHTTSVIVPDGQTAVTDDREAQVRFHDRVDFIEEDNALIEEGGTLSAEDKRDELTDLLASLSPSVPTQHQVASKHSKSAKKTSAINKKKTSPKVEGTTKATGDSDNSCTPAGAAGNGKKTGRQPKKKTKKQKRSNNTSEPTSPTDSQVLQVTPDQLAVELTNTSIEDVMANTTGDQDSEKRERRMSMAEKRLGLQSAKAEQRRLEIERKRQEKRELELEKARELARNRELMDQLSAYKEEPDDKENIEEPSIISLIDEGKVHIPIEETITPVTDVQLEETTYEPSVKTRESSELLKRARERREEQQREEAKRIAALREQQRLKLLEEERLAKSKKELELMEEAKREQSVKDIGKKVKGKEELNYKMRLELEAQKYHQRKTPSHIFSYFCYLPQKQSKDKKKRQRTTLPKRTKS